MLLPLILVFLATPACLAGEDADPETLDDFLRQYCRNNPTDEYRRITSSIFINGQFGDIGSRGETGEPGFPGPTGPVGLQNDTLIREKFLENLETVFRHMNWSAFLGVKLQSCQDVIDKLSFLPYVKSGVFSLYRPNQGWTDVYCDLTGEQEGWTVFQRRMDGSVEFYRGWDDYVNGFGDEHGEFWLGLEEMHRLTRSGQHELRIDMISDNGTYVRANYRHFKIGPASDKYRLYVGGYSGNATDALANPPNVQAIHNGRQFSTYDNDGGNCAQSWKGAWWYKFCYYSNLNGLYHDKNYQGVVWRTTDDQRMNMRFTEMRLRRVPADQH